MDVLSLRIQGIGIMMNIAIGVGSFVVQHDLGGCRRLNIIGCFLVAILGYIGYSNR